jgi:hypothetical protein
MDQSYKLSSAFLTPYYSLLISWRIGDSKKRKDNSENIRTVANTIIMLVIPQLL